MLATVLTQAVWFSVASMMAVLARKRFGAGDWQTLMITAAVPTLMITAVFWNHLLRRIPLRRYLAIHWACTMIPLAVAGLSNSFPFLLTFHILAAIGAAGWSPIAGELLRRFYGDQVRGRAFGLINVAMFLGMIALSITIGRRLDANEDIFRIYLPGAAVAYGLGILILRRLVRSTGVERERRKELDHLAVCSPEPRASARADFPSSTGREAPVSSPLTKGGHRGVDPEPRASARADFPSSTGREAPPSSPLTKGGHRGVDPEPRASARADSPSSTGPEAPVSSPLTKRGHRGVDPEPRASARADFPSSTPSDTPSSFPTVKSPLSLRKMFDPVVHMRSVLRSDRTFFRYEAAFMTYGLGWMICYALLPVLATDRLKMSYTDFADSTGVICPLFMLLTVYPMGWLMDRVGPARLSSYSFAWLTLYPIALALSDSVTDVGLATAIYGSGMAGVHIGWMLGPVTLAPSRDHVAQYVAIHTTLVGVRGIVAQGLGMLIYTLTGSFNWAFAVAAVCFAWAAIQMKQLRGKLSEHAQSTK